MNFRTVTKIDKRTGFFSHRNQLIAIGSCFSSNIGSRLSMGQFNIKHDQFGTLFNPFSIAKNIQNSVNNELDENLILERDGKFYHYDFPSNFIGTGAPQFSNWLSTRQQNFLGDLQCANRLIITFGTAWVYRLLEQDKIVANCHKIPQKEFSKELLDLDELKSIYLTLFSDLKKENPKLEIVLTVSPVRHIKNGLRDNNLSKSILLLLTSFLENKFDFVHYFPAYELVMDDLRDYRFFTKDMIHPNEQAIDYVYERFQETYFSNQTTEIVELASKLSRMGNHNFMSPTAEQVVMNKEKMNTIKQQIAELKSQA